MSEDKAVALTDAQAKRAAEVQLISMGNRGIQLQTYGDMWSLSTAVHKSGMAPAALKSPEAVMVAAQTGMEAGLTFMRSLQAVNVIEGQPSWKAHTVLALVRAAGYKIRADFDRDEEGAPCRGWCKATRDGEDYEYDFTEYDRKTADLTGKNWTRYPGDMFVARAITRMGNRVFSDILLNLPTSEDLQDRIGDTGRVVQTDVVVTARVAPEGPDPLQVQLEAERTPPPPSPSGQTPADQQEEGESNDPAAEESASRSPEGPETGDGDGYEGDSSAASPGPCTVYEHRQDEDGGEVTTVQCGLEEGHDGACDFPPLDPKQSPPPAEKKATRKAAAKKPKPIASADAEPPPKSDSVDLPPLVEGKPCPKCGRDFKAFGHGKTDELDDCPYGEENP